MRFAFLAFTAISLAMICRLDAKENPVSNGALNGTRSAIWTAEQEAPAGKAPYDRVCSVCHGMEGRGDAGPGPGLIPFERDYRDLLAIVREGSGEMPGIAKERVSDDAVQQIFEYLKSLNAAPQPR